jgi:lipopolysaccharide biosynthesis protein
LISPKYIKVQNKPILGIYDPSSIPEVKSFLVELRKEAKKQEIGEIYILAPAEFIPRMIVNFIDASFDMNPKEYYQYKYYKNNEYFYYSSSLIFHTKLSNKKYENHTLYRGNVIEYDSSHTTNESIIYDEYTPEKFYESNRILINKTKNLFTKNNQFYFINGWNNWLEGSYLEPDNNYGYAALNSFSKALYDLPYNSSKIYNFDDLFKETTIAVQAHIFYADLIEEMNNKINNIPFKFDLYISTDSFEKKNIIEKYVKGNTKANYYEIMVIENRGRDLFPMVMQMKNKIWNYKYFCHIHSKKSNSTEFGNAWRDYLFQNLLGNEDIIKDNLDTLINKEDIGFIYPEVVYKLTKMPFTLAKDNNNYLNYIINKIFPGYEIGKKLKYPLGNMFWARVDSIKQAFGHKYVYMLKKIDSEKDWKFTSHFNEIFWLYLVKMNGYFYKTIFKSI